MNIAVKNILDHFEFEQYDHGRFQLYREQSDVVKNSFADDVLQGLKTHPKQLMPKYFYDDTGSNLFDKITRTPEYYPTRAEKSILVNNVREVRDICHEVRTIAELGSGTSEKTDILLETFLSAKNLITYVPIDVSDILITSSENLLSRYQDLTITGIVSEYESGLNLLGEFDEHPKLIIFLGSSIGNFDRAAADDLLCEISDAMTKHDYLLIGFDLVKNVETLNQAYNDREKYTESFNLNILDRINKELGGNFRLQDFKHKAYYNTMASRVEMHLVSAKDQRVFIQELNTSVDFKQGESVHTENSYKFTEQRINSMANQAGLQVMNTWRDEKDYFALTLFKLI